MAEYKYPAGVGDGIFHACIQFTEWQRDDRNSSFPTNTYTLYMPERLVNPNTVSWDSEKFGIVANKITNFVGGGQQGVLDSLSDVGSVALHNLKYNLLGSVAQMLGSSASTEAIRAASSQKIPNPYLTMIFRGVDFRTFEFTFKLYPHSQEDTLTIYEMIKSFRKAALPPGSGAGGGPAFLGYPNEFTIEYIYNGERNPWLNRFKRCVIVGIDTDYTGSGMWSMTRDGFPAEITLNLRFSEIEIVLRDDVEEGY